MSTKQCPFCAEEIKPEAIKCKHCGADLEKKTAPKTSSDKISSTEGAAHQLRRASFAKGLGASILFGILAIGIGGLLTLTIIGSIVGVPMMLIGGGAIALSPFMFLAMSEGSCPYCQSAVIVMNGKKVAKCNSCKNRFSIRDSQAYRIPK